MAEETNKQRSIDDALKAMAEGQDLSEESTEQAAEGIAAELNEPQAAPDDAPLDFAESDPMDDAPAAEAFAIHDSGAMRRAHAAQYQQQASRANTHTYKRTMVPLLLVVGLLLLIMGGAAFAFLPSSEMAEVIRRTNPDALSISPVMRYMAILSFPLGAILMLGAWMFHQEIRRSDGR
jgi:hypothetical protein